MRPYKAKCVVRTAIESWLNGDDSKILSPDCLRAVVKLQYIQKVWFKQHGHTYDVGCVEHADDAKYIRNEMSYISDRFNAPNRLEWLKVGITHGLFKL